MGAGDRSSVSAAIDRRWGTPCTGHSGTHRKGMLLSGRCLASASHTTVLLCTGIERLEEGLAPSRPLEAMRLEEVPERLGDLLIARLAVDQPVMGMGTERFELRVEPFG